MEKLQRITAKMAIPGTNFAAERVIIHGLRRAPWLLEDEQAWPVPVVECRWPECRWPAARRAGFHDPGQVQELGTSRR